MSFEKQTKRDVYFKQMESEILSLLDPQTGRPRADLVEHVDCPVCGRKGTPALVKWGFTYDKCDTCSSFFVNPRLKESSVIEIYKSGSKANAMWAEMVHLSERQAKENQRYFIEQVAELKKYVQGGTLVDVGCGTGDFLDQAAQSGFQCSGLEISENAVKIARSKGHQVRELLLESPELQDKSHKTVTMFGVMEHLFDPRRDMKRVHDILEDGGVFLGITPNAFSLVGMLLHEKAQFFTPRNHPVIFSPRGVRKLLEETGFEILQLDTVLSGYESIVNFLQYRNPFGDFDTTLVPEKLEGLLKSQPKFEALLREFDLGLRLRVIARKKS